MNKVFHRIFSLVLAISLLFCISAVQAENTEYPLEVHVDMAELTVRLPSSAIYVTQDSTVNDLYFQIAGADSYDAVMADLTTNSVYFDGIDMGYSWEIRIAVQPGAPFSLKGSNQAFAQMFLDAIVSDFTNRGVKVDDTFVCESDDHTFLALRANMGGRNMYTIMTTSGTKLLAITIADVYAGSIAMDELKNVTMAIINGFVFD